MPSDSDRLTFWMLPWQRPMAFGADALRYWIQAGGVKVIRPFHYRWLMTRICGHSVVRWWACWLTAYVGSAALMGTWAWQTGLGWEQALGAGVLLVILPGIRTADVVRPIAPDILAMFFGLAAVVLLEAGAWPLAIVAALLAGCTKETSPVYAALWAWNPIVLVGLLAPALRHVLVKPGTEDPAVLGGFSKAHQEVCEHPLVGGMSAHFPEWHDWQQLVVPWGGALLALADPTPQLLAVLAAAYLSLAVATDTTRIYQYAAGPVMVLVAMTVAPVWAVLPLLAITWFSPWHQRRI